MSDQSLSFYAGENLPLQTWLNSFSPSSAGPSHGRAPEWQAAIAQLPTLVPSSIELKAALQIGSAHDIDPLTQAQLIAALKQLHPWRKGPFELYGVHLDCEWRSDWKWARIAPHLDLRGKRILDVGCGNGYYAWRMMGGGAESVIGLEPFPLYVYQFLAIRRLLENLPHAPRFPLILPVGLEALPTSLHHFDTLFSLGVLYHRPSPLDHLRWIHDTLRGGGELVLETMVIEGKRGEVLIPKGRYAQMRNVSCIPSCLTLESWLQQCGFREIRLVDVTPTTTAEQRATEWMTFQSLADFLDPRDPSRTVEGYPGPIRAVFLAKTGSNS